mgnify:CR=1 FL=1
MTLSLVAVFIPVLFMGGILGRLLREFAVTIIVAVLISGFVSLTLTPMPCSRMLVDEHKRQARSRLRVVRAHVRARCSTATGATLALGAASPAAHVLASFAGIAIATGDSLRARCRRDSCPPTTTGQILVFTEAAQDVSFDAMARDAAAGRRNRQGESARRRARCPRSAPAAPARRSTSAASSSR